MLTSFRPSRLGATSDKERVMCDKQEIFGEPTIPSGPSSPRVAPTQHCETEESTGNAAHATTHIIPDTTTEVIILDPNDVGIPNETKWDVNGGYNSRFCFQHRQKFREGSGVF
jgi:hypothetical protein